MPARKTSSQPQKAADTAPAEAAGDKNLCNERERMGCNDIQHVECADGEIAKIICQLEKGLEGIDIMEREHQARLVEIQTTGMKNEITMQTFCKFGGSESDSNEQAITPTTFKTPPQIRSAANTQWVSSIRGCVAIEGDESDVWCHKKPERPMLILPKVKKQRLNQEQVETIQNNTHIAKPPKEPPPESYIKQQPSKCGRQRRQLRGCRPKFGWNRGCKRDQIGSREGVLDIRISMHSGTGTNAGPQPNYGTYKWVSAGHETGRDTHGRLARRQARDQQRARLLSRQ